MILDRFNAVPNSWPVFWSENFIEVISSATVGGIEVVALKVVIPHGSALPHDLPFLETSLLNRAVPRSTA
jgi:hypothetical protein